MTARIAGLVFLVLIGVAIAFHLALILGAPWGHLTSGGRWPGTLPVEGRAVSALSIVTLLLIGRVVGERAGLFRQALPRWALDAALVWLALGVVLNTITPSPMERAIWLPVLLASMAAALVVRARGPR